MSEKIPNFDYDADEVIKDFKENFKWPTNNDVTVVVKPPKLALKLVLAFIATIVVGGVYFYATVPAINIHASEFYTYLILLVATFMVSFYMLIGANKKIERREFAKKHSKIPVIIIAIIFIVMVVGFVVGSTLFRSHDYSQIMTVTESDFATDFSDISYDEVPRLDESRAKTLADQQLGSLSEYKSQYVVSNDSTQINYNDAPVRVAYLEYADVFKWFNNTKDGLPAYMLIDVVSQKVQVVNCVEKFGEGIKYSPTELFNEKILRHLRFQYPTAIFDTPNFEIADDDRPYWITPVLDKTIGLFGGTDVKGVVITDALTGESTYYDIQTVRESSELNWIDVVYSEKLLIEQYNYYGKLSNGFWNSIIFQDDVNIASSGNGFIAMDDDVWVYTGVTSIESDTSNFGFILCNQRTKETRYYENGGAIETSAMESAKDAVQNYGYYPTFPILLSIEGNPTYFMSLYGDSNTVKGYALVSLEDKTIVGTGLLDVEKSDAKALNAAVANYIDALKDKDFVDESIDAEDILVDEEELEADTPDAPAATDKATVTGAITDIKSSVNDGNTVYYLQVNGVYYYIAVTDCMEVLLMNVGDTVTVTCTTTDGTFIPADSITK